MKFLAVVLMALSTTSASQAQQTTSTIAIPAALGGTWKSANEVRWNGPLRLKDIQVTGNEVTGQIHFATSGCDWWNAFTGEVAAEGMTLLSHAGGDCGDITVRLYQSGGTWKGTYNAEYPDDGAVNLTEN